MTNDVNKKKYSNVAIAAGLSYIYIIANSVFNLVAIPFILLHVGDSQYGVYKTVGSFAASLALLDLGLGATITRFSARYHAENDKNGISRLFFHALVIDGVICIAVCIVAVIGYHIFINTYQNSFTEVELSLSKTIYYFACTQLIVTTLDNVLYGMIAGANQFVYTNLVKLGAFFLRVILIIVLIISTDNIIVVSIANVCASLLTVLLDAYFIRFILQIHTEVTRIDKVLIRSLLSYTGLMLVQTLIEYINSNIDIMMIGRLENAKSVAIYSVGIDLYRMFQMVSTSISSLMLPVITNMIVRKSSNTEIENYVIKVGRVQFILLAAIDSAFFFFGKEFINLWLGDGYQKAWVVANVLFLSGTIPLAENVMISVLRAENLMIFRTFALFIMASLNVILTYEFINLWGFVSASFATGLGFLLVNTFIMNIYYYKKIKYDVFRILRKIFVRTGICAAFAGAVTFFLTKATSISPLYFGLKCSIFAVVYFVAIYFFSMTNDEKGLINKYVNKKWFQRKK